MFLQGNETFVVTVKSHSGGGNGGGGGCNLVKSNSGWVRKTYNTSSKPHLGGKIYNISGSMVKSNRRGGLGWWEKLTIVSLAARQSLIQRGGIYSNISGKVSCCGRRQARLRLNCQRFCMFSSPAPGGGWEEMEKSICQF